MLDIEGIDSHLRRNAHGCEKRLAGARAQAVAEETPDCWRSRLTQGSIVQTLVTRNGIICSV